MVSIVICTYNRVASLRHVLADLSRLRAPRGHDVEVLVVDNNSTDDTAEAVMERRTCGPYLLRYVRETKQGLSHARNRGIAEADGDWIVFTDDDVRIPHDWLAELMSAADEDGAIAVGGRVEPIWPDRVPSWVAQTGPFLQHGVFLNYDLGDGRRQLGMADAFPFGCNMAFHRRAFTRYGQFRSDLGRVGSRLLAGEDTDMFERLARAGEAAIYTSAAIVRHPVEQHRLTLSYLSRWKFWAGYGDGRTPRLKTGRSVFGVPGYIYKCLLGDAAKLAGSVLINRPAQAAFYMANVCVRAGFACGRWFGGTQTAPAFRFSPGASAPEVEMEKAKS